MKDLSDEEEEALNNELKDDFEFSDAQNIDQYIDDDDEEINEKDDIEEDLGLVSLDEDFDGGEEMIVETSDEEEDEEEDI